MTDNRFLIKPQKFGIKAKLEEARTALQVVAKDLPNKIGIIFDDSISMGGKPIEDAHTAIDTFVKNCNKGDTALCLFPLNAPPKELSTDYIEIAMYGMQLRPAGGTPFYRTLRNLLEQPINRAVAFSDGEPTDMASGIIEQYIEKKIPIDTVFIGEDGSHGSSVLKDIAERTGGVFLHFKDSSDLAKGFKYLTPAYRALLTSGAIDIKAVERGEV